MTTNITIYETMQPLLNPLGELDLGAFHIAERLQKFMDFRQKANCNLPLWENNILQNVPEGVKWLPVPIIPKASDGWGENPEDAKKMKLKEGHVEPSADFLNRISSIMGIVLKEVFSGVVNDAGQPMYRVRYNAFLALPNGLILQKENQGKDQAIYDKAGENIIAHVVESTRKKAERNAIKALLGIPTTMPREEFFRPWIVLVPIFDNKSQEAIQITVEAKQAENLLYPHPQASLILEMHEAINNAITLETIQGIDKWIEGQYVNIQSHPGFNGLKCAFLDKKNTLEANKFKSIINGKATE